MKLSNEAFINMYCRPTIPPMICNQPAVVYRLDVLLTYHYITRYIVVEFLKEAVQWLQGSKGLITICVDSLAFLYFSRFDSRFD